MINKNIGYTPECSMRAMIRDNSSLLPVISRFGISFGFGDRSIGDICEDAQVDTATFLSVCNLLSGYPSGPEDISLAALMEYLNNAHVSFLTLDFPRIRHHLIEAINSADSDGVVLMLVKFFDDYVVEVKRHLDHENDVVFAHVDSLLEGKRLPGYSVAEFSVDHEPMAEKLRELKDIFIYHYRKKDDGRLSATLKDIINCEQDLTEHFEVENRLFAPAAAALEESVGNIASAETVAQHDAADDASDVLVALTNREKDIIRCVAKGMANKEIADALCISLHTVATHRRNIAAKLDIHSAAALTIFAILHGLITVDEAKSMS